jgi:hypothetical protein
MCGKQFPTHIPDMNQHQDKELAIKVIKQLWPTVRISDANVTPDVADYVFRVLIEAKEGHRVVKALAPLSGLTTSWTGLGVKLIQSVRKYSDQQNDWGLAIQAAVASHQRSIQSAMDYGTETYPLSFR